MMRPQDQIRQDEPCPGLWRLAARFQGHAYDRHRHDSYAIGETLFGAQAFQYRGAERVSHAGQIMVIHPDEAHDGHADVPEGFAYRMLYVDPALIGAALDGASPPFVPDVVAADPELARIIGDGFEEPTDPLAINSIVTRLADRLQQRSDRKARPQSGYSLAAIERVRSFLEETTDATITSAALERIADMDRFALARAFRAAFGTSPHRYLVARRIARAQRLMASGTPLAEAAIAAGFADQSHFTRHFKAHMGLTPGRFIHLQSEHPRSNGRT